MVAWVVIYRRHLRQPRKSHLPRALGAIGDSGPAGKDAILLSLFDFQLLTSESLLLQLFSLFTPRVLSKSLPISHFRTLS